MTGYFGSMFQGVGGTMPGQGGNHFRPGFSGLVVIEAIKVQQSHRGGHTNVITEMRVLESNQAEKPVGSAASWVLNTQHQPWKGNYTWLLAACAGIDISNEAEVKRQITDQVAEFAVSPQQPMRGKVVRLQTEEITTQGKRQPFTKHIWKPVDQSVYQAQVHALLASAPVPAPGQQIPSSPQQPPAGFNLPQGTPQGQPPQGFGMPAAAAPQGFGGFAPPGGTPGYAPPATSAPAGYSPPGFAPPGGAPTYAPATSAPAGYAPPGAAGGFAPPGGFGGAPAAAPAHAAPPAMAMPPAAPAITDWTPNVNDPTGTWEWSPSTGKQRNKITGQIQG